MQAQISILRDIIYGASAYGGDIHRMCAALDIDPHDLHDSERFVPFKPAAEVWDVALAETGEQFLGLYLGEKMSPAILGMIGYLMQSSQTLLEAVLSLARFNDLHSTMMKYEVVESGDRVEITYHPAEIWIQQYPESVRQSLELAMSGLVTLFRLISSRPIYPLRVELSFEARSRTEYERIFRAEIQFNSKRNATTFRKSDLLSPVVSHDKSLYVRFSDILEKKLQSINAQETLTDKIGHAILLDFKGNSPSVEVMAAHMNMTPRTIQRKLKDEETTYRAIAARFKRELATVVMENNKFGITEVARMLGYSDSSALRKAMRKWS
ncbi:AraC family transcriptional regulator ligand-binding domain-containing protein [Chryseolinea sp. T2]|uniref:AraC family transcriptional regulator n=1 Tax=Chryseolinea sp. T2 TaxID=3129255 RepID=UPI0030787383